MGDSNGRLIDSPFGSVCNSNEKSNSPPSLDRSVEIRSNTSSPLLDTEPLPLDDHSQCPYCHKDFRKPRVLDCLHSMCEDCIIAQLDGRREAQKAHQLATTRDSTDCELEAPKVRERPTPPGVIRCPICSQESHVGNDVRYVHTMLLDYARLAEHDDPRGEKRCRACKSEQAAVAICKQCQSDLCANCLNAHSVMRMFDGHQVMSYAEMEQLGERGDLRPVPCPSHTHPYKTLCATCETLACKTCLENEHANHKLIDVNELVINAIQKEMLHIANGVMKKWKEAMNEWNAIPDRSGTLHEQYDIAKGRMEEFFDLLGKALETAKTKKLAELEEARHKQEASIEDLYHKMNLTEARVNDAINFTDRLVKQANGMELLASRRKVVQQLNNLAHTMPMLGIQVELEFHPLNMKQIESQMNAACGTVIGRMVSASVKDQPGIQIGDLSGNHRTSVDGADWSRSNGASANAPGAPVSQLPAIGTERKKVPGGYPRQDGFLWPPSSNPPEMPTPSPPVSAAQLRELPQPLMAVPTPAPTSSMTSIYNSYQWPPSSNPPVPDAFYSSLSQTSKLNASQIMELQMQLAAQNQRDPLSLAQREAIIRNGLSLANQSAAVAAAGRFRAAGYGIDSMGIANLNIGGMGDGPLPIATQRASPQDGTKSAPELKIHSVFGTSAQGSSIRELHNPSGFCLSENDDILIADTNNHRVIVCGPPHPWRIGRAGTEDGQLCFPRRVVALKGDVTRYVVLDKGGDGKTRAQIFDLRGEFVKKINLMNLVPRGGIEVSAATCTPAGHLLLVDNSAVIYCIDVDTPRVVFWFDASSHLGEASDVAIYEKNVYVTDFKHHCVQVFNIDGQFIRKLGEPSQTPYPIGIDVSKKGEVLVADTHGNHLHVVVFSPDGFLQQSFTHQEFRLSRCVGLRVAGSGHVVTLCKHNHTLFVFKPLYLR